MTDTVAGSQVDLEAGQPDIIFFFNAGLLSNPAHIEFRYRLTGYDAEWTSTRSHSARYRRLSPGKYRFEVQARNRGEEWLSPIAELPVRQRPHLYQTWYFYLSLLFLTATIAVHLFRRRVQMMKGRIGIVLEERNRISRKCHDTLMAGFAAISWQLEATAKLFRDSDSASTPAAKSCELARSVVAHCQAEARRIIRDLRDAEEGTNILLQALSRTLATNQMQELTPGCVHHLVCIGQEAVSTRFAMPSPRPSSSTSSMRVTLSTLSIRDDGRGFYASDRSTSRRGHFGIPVMEERARKLGGTFRLQTSSRAWPYSVLSGHPQIRIIGEAGDGEVGMTMYRTLRPDAVVLDLRLPRVSGFDVIIQLRKEFPNADVYGPFAAAQWLISPKTPVGKNS